MLAVHRQILPILACVFSSIQATDVTLPIVVHDYLKGTTTQVQITGKLYDSTAGSWVGTRPGLDGLPTPPFSWNPPYDLLRHNLQNSDSPPGWPGRIAFRLDHENVDGSLGHYCSGTLIGPKFALTAAHCVNYRSYDSIKYGWTSDTLFVRPGFDRGHDLPSSSELEGIVHPARVVKSWIPRSIFESSDLQGYGYSGDDDWAVLELERDVGTELGWARVGPLKPGDEAKMYHMLGYAGWANPHPGADTVCRSDTLDHAFTPVTFQYWDPTGRNQQGDWMPLLNAWRGESGSGFLDCPDETCLAGNVTLRGTRWTEYTISAIDSVMSGIIAKILKDVKVPTATVASAEHPDFAMHMDRGFLQASADREGEWQILSLDGRLIGAPTFGRSLSVAADRLPPGVALVVFHAPGQVPVTRRWVGR